MAFNNPFFRPALCILAITAMLPAQQAPRAQRVIVHGPISYLGVGAIAVDAEIAKSLGLKEERGVQITDLVEDGPAYRAGLKEHDVILDFDGQRISGIAQFVQLVAETPINKTVKLGVFRGGAMRTIAVQVGQRMPESFTFEAPLPPMGPMPPMPPKPPEMTMPDIPTGLLSWQSASLGYLSEPVEGQLAEFFGVKEGVLIRSVEKQSAADKAGLKAGDVIVKVDGTAVRSPREITSMAHRRREKKSLSLTVVRSHKEITLELIGAIRSEPVMSGYNVQVTESQREG